MPTRPITIESLHETIKIVEEEFGLDWLKRKSDTSSAKRSSHPVPHAWANTVEIVKNHTLSRSLLFPDPVIWLASFSHHLDTIRKIKGYSEAVKYRLKDAKEFTDVEYEIFVASLWAKSDYQVEFIPRKDKEGIKTSDLKILFGDVVIHIEPIQSDNNIFFEKISTGLQTWHEENTKDKDSPIGTELLVVVPGEQNPSDAEHIVSDLRHKSIESEAMSWAGRKAAYLLRRLPKQETSDDSVDKFKLSVPAHYNPSWVSAKVAEDEYGKRYASNLFRFALFTIKSHKFSSLHNSFNKARKQIPSNTVGLIYLDIDISNLRVPEIMSYLPMITDSIGKELAESVNTRIAGVVVTTQPVIDSAEIGGVKGRTQIRFVHVKRNPHVSLPQGFLIPLEQTK